MDIVVCVKRVPASDSLIKIRAGADGIETGGITCDVNPYDEYAVEEALRIRESKGGGKVTILSIGPEAASEVIRKCLAMGADEGVHVCDPALEGADPLTTARVLAAAIKKETLPYQLILCGKQSIDDDAAQVGPMLGELLGIPHVSVVVKLVVEADRIQAHRVVEGDTETFESPMPVVVTAHKGLNEPRYPSLKGIMGAKKKPIKKLSAANLGLPASVLDPKQRRLKVVKLEAPPGRPAGRVIKGEPEEAARELVGLLREEARIF